MLDAAPPPVYNKKTGSAPAQPRGVAQLVARVVWDHEAAGSSPVTSTTTKAVDSLKSTAFVILSTHFKYTLMLVYRVTAASAA